jgi:non-canonical (house-cleaning) NTP pyrophosphatase
VAIGREGRTGKARTGTYYLSEETAKLVRDGMELGHADDVIFGRTNSKQQSGSVGLLTDGVVDRTGFIGQAVILALIPFKNVGLSF